MALVPACLGLLVGATGCIELATFGSIDTAPDTHDAIGADLVEIEPDILIFDHLDEKDDGLPSETDAPSLEVDQDTAGEVGADTSDTGTLDTSDTGTLDTSDTGTLDTSDTSDTDALDTTTVDDADDADTLPPSALASAQLQLILDTPDGEVSLPVEGAFVTATRPALGAEPAGFFIQAERQGPALFVAVDPAAHDLLPGDLVSLRVTSLATVTSRREASSIAEVQRHSRDHDLEPLVQDITLEAELLTRLDDFESELVRVHATLASDWWPSGLELLAQIDTAAIAADERLVVRLPADLVDALDLAKGCAVTLTGPLWRAGPTAQPTAYTLDALEPESCPAPRLLSALATNPTGVTLRFDRRLAPLPSPPPAPSDLALITSAHGSLTVTSASVSGRELLLETSPQSPVTYTVTVGPDLVDLGGRAVPPTANRVDFSGFGTPALLVINEVNPTIRYAVGCDLIELRAVRGGALDGIRLYSNATLIVALGPPRLAQVARGDLIVVHLNPAGIDCRGTTPTGDPLGAALSETLAKDEVASSTYYDDAWDLWSVTSVSELSPNNFVLILEDASGAIMDAAAFHRAGQLVSGPSISAAERARLAGQWADPGAPYNEARYIEHAVLGIDTTYTSPADPSLRRVTDTDTDSRLDWDLGPSSFGALNPGQLAR